MNDKERLAYAITLDMSQLESATKRASNAFTHMGSNIETESRRIDQSMKTIGTAAAAYFSVSALNNFTQSVIQVRGEIESLEISFATLLGSTSKAKELFGAIREFEVKTPMTLEPLAKGAQTMLGFGIAVEKVMPILRQIGDISMGNTERFNSLVLAFSQASANGKLMGQDLLQMINAGFNPLNQISKDTGKSIAELRDEMSKGAISAADMEKAFAAATAEGGQFYGMLEKQSQGINGSLSNLEGAWNSMLNEIGSKQQETFVNGVNMLSNIIQHYDVFMNAILSVAAAYGTYKAALMALWVVEKARNLTDNIRLIMMFRKELGLLTAAQQAFNITALANPYILLVGAITGVVAALVLYNDELTEAEKKQSELQSNIDTINSKSQERKQKIESLVRVIRDETTAETESAKALKELRSLLPETTKGISNQAIKTGDLTKFTKSYNEELSKQIGLEKQRELNRLYAQKKDLEYWIKTDRSTKGYKYTHRANENQAILEVVNKQIEALEKEKKEFLDLQKQLDNEKPSIYGEDYRKAKKEWEEAKRELEKIQKDKDEYTSNEYKEAQSRVESTKKAYEALGGDINLKSLQKQSNDQSKLLKEVSKTREEVLQNATNAEISTMREGLAKRLREIENQKEQTLAAIDKEESELSEKLEKVGQTLSASDKQAFKIQREAANTEAINARFEAEKENAEYVKGLYKNLTDVFVSEEERKIGAIKQTYQEQRKQLGKNLAGGNITQGQYYELSNKINAAESREMADYWLSSYGDYYQKREKLQTDWEARLARIPAKYQAEANRMYLEELSSLDLGQFKKDVKWEDIFSDLASQTSDALMSLREKLEQYINSAADKISPESLKDLQKELREIDAEITKRNPFRSLIKDLGDFENAQGQVKKAQEELNTVTSGGEVVIGYYIDETGKLVKELLTVKQAEENLTEAMNSRKKAMLDIAKSASGVGEEIGKITNAASSIINTIEGTFGVEVNEDIKKVIDGFAGISDGLSNMAKSAINLDIAGIVSGAVQSVGGFLKSIGGMFGIDWNGGKSRKRYEEAAGQYDKYMDVLDKVIDKQRELVESMSASDLENADNSYEYALQLIKNQEEAARKLGQQYLNSGAGVFSHSEGVKQRRNISKEAWDEYGNLKKDIDKLKELDLTASELDKAIGGRMTGMFNLSATQLEYIMTNAPTFWAQLGDETRKYLEQIIKCEEASKDLEESLNEAITGVSFESFSDGVLEQLYDVETTAEDIFESMGDSLRKSLIKNMYAKTYEPMLKKWYDMWAGYMKDGDIDTDEQTALDKLKESIVNGAMSSVEAINKQWATVKNEETERSSSSKGVVQASQESVDRMEGRVTVMQGHTYSINEGIKDLNSVSVSILEKVSGIKDDTANLAGMAENIYSMKASIDSINLKGVKIKK